MISLKEIKSRILSVTSTKKITSAMKMVSSAKLHKSQAAITNFLPYEEKLNFVTRNFLSQEANSNPFAENREISKVTLVLFSSKSSHCGAYNNNVIRKFEEVNAQYKDAEVTIYTIGKKVHEYVTKRKYNVAGSFDFLTEKPDYNEISKLVDTLTNSFLSGKTDRIELIFNHFKSAGTQIIQTDTLLPFTFKEQENDLGTVADYIVETDKESLIQELIPKVIRSKMYGTLLDSIASEHGARTTAMQVASENASELIQDLTLQYNKARQEVITNEILDIVGGSEASRKG